MKGGRAAFISCIAACVALCLVLLSFPAVNAYTISSNLATNTQVVWDYTDFSPFEIEDGAIIDDYYWNPSYTGAPDSIFWIKNTGSWEITSGRPDDDDPFSPIVRVTDLGLDIPDGFQIEVVRFVFDVTNFFHGADPGFSGPIDINANFYIYSPDQQFYNDHFMGAVAPSTFDQPSTTNGVWTWEFVRRSSDGFYGQRWSASEGFSDDVIRNYRQYDFTPDILSGRTPGMNFLFQANHFSGSEGAVSTVYVKPRVEVVLSDPSGTLTFCGDGNVDTPNSFGNNEECDDGNNIGRDGCSASCRTESGQINDYFISYDGTKQETYYENSDGSCGFEICSNVDDFEIQLIQDANWLIAGVWPGDSTNIGSGYLSKRFVGEVSQRPYGMDLLNTVNCDGSTCRLTKTHEQIALAEDFPFVLPGDAVRCSREPWPVCSYDDCELGPDQDKTVGSDVVFVDWFSPATVTGYPEGGPDSLNSPDVFGFIDQTPGVGTFFGPGFWDLSIGLADTQGEYFTSRNVLTGERWQDVDTSCEHTVISGGTGPVDFRTDRCVGEWYGFFDSRIDPLACNPDGFSSGCACTVEIVSTSDVEIDLCITTGPVLVCDEDSDCPSGSSCLTELGMCWSDTACTPPACFEDSDCPPGTVCEGGECTDPCVRSGTCCTQDSDCPDGLCNNGVCTETLFQCGDGLAQFAVGESCDDGPQGSATCYGSVGQDSRLSLGQGSAQCQIPACGDGVIDNVYAGETCDDGNTDDGDGCSSACLIEAVTCASGGGNCIDIPPAAQTILNNAGVLGTCAGDIHFPAGDTDCQNQGFTSCCVPSGGICT